MRLRRTDRRPGRAARTTWIAALFMGLVGAAGAARATVWQDGQVATYSQEAWGEPTSIAGQILNARINDVFPNGFEVGIPGAAGHSIFLTDQFAVYALLPQFDIPYILLADDIDPLHTSSGEFAGEAVALDLNIAFGDRGLLGGQPGLRFGNLVLHDDGLYPLLNGLSVRQILAEAQVGLGGGVTPYTPDDWTDILLSLNTAFPTGVATAFADSVLEIAPAQAAPAPEPSTWALMLAGLFGLGALLRAAPRRAGRSAGG